MKTKHIAVAVAVAIACSGVAVASAMSANTSTQKQLPGEILGQQFRDAQVSLQSYDDFADLRLTSKLALVLSWRGQVPSKVRENLHSIFGDRTIVERQVPFNLKELATAQTDTYVLLAKLEKQGLIRYPGAFIGLDARSIRVNFGLVDPANKAAVVAQIEAYQPVPVRVSYTDVNGLTF